MAYATLDPIPVGGVVGSPWLNQVKDNFEYIRNNAAYLNQANTFVGTQSFSGNILVSGATQVIDGGNKVSVKGDASASGAAYFTATDSTGVNNAFFGATATIGFMGTFTNKSFEIRTNNAARMTLTTTGSILIGKSSGLTGAGDLDIAGNLRVTGVPGFNGKSPSIASINGSRSSNTVYVLTQLLSALNNNGLVIDTTTT